MNRLWAGRRQAVRVIVRQEQLTLCTVGSCRAAHARSEE